MSPRLPSTAFIPALPVAPSYHITRGGTHLDSSFPPHDICFRSTPPNHWRVTPTQTTKAVLDTPASNTYLQRYAELALRDFLTRRAVSTVLFYMHEFHDGPSHHWLSNFDSFSDRVKARQFKNGDQFLEKMRQAPIEKGFIQIGHPSGRFSRKFPFTIEPGRIASRIVDARVQLSEEWAHDLHCIEAENLEIQRLSFERLLSKSEADLNSKRNLIYDSDPFANDESALRFRNYTALKTLLTQHAVMRLLPYIRDRGSNHEYMYLLQFLATYGPIGDDTKFFETLMRGATQQRRNPSFLVVPRSIAIQILDLRTELAKEWISALEFIPIETKLSMCGALEKSMDASHGLLEDGHTFLQEDVGNSDTVDDSDDNETK